MESGTVSTPKHLENEVEIWSVRSELFPSSYFLGWQFVVFSYPVRWQSTRLPCSNCDYFGFFCVTAVCDHKNRIVSLSGEESARTLGVLVVNGGK